jgi:hypothetical protein
MSPIQQNIYVWAPTIFCACISGIELKYNIYQLQVNITQGIGLQYKIPPSFVPNFLCEGRGIR